MPNYLNCFLLLAKIAKKLALNMAASECNPQKI